MQLSMVKMKLLCGCRLNVSLPNNISFFFIDLAFLNSNINCPMTLNTLLSNCSTYSIINQLPCKMLPTINCVIASID